MLVQSLADAQGYSVSYPDDWFSHKDYIDVGSFLAELTHKDADFVPGK